MSTIDRITRPRTITVTIEDVEEVEPGGLIRTRTVSYLIDRHAKATVETNTRFDERGPCEENNWSPIIHAEPTGRYDFTLTIENARYADD